MWLHHTKIHDDSLLYHRISAFAKCSLCISYVLSMEPSVVLFLCSMRFSIYLVSRPRVPGVSAAELPLQSGPCRSRWSWPEAPSLVSTPPLHPLAGRTPVLLDSPATLPAVVIHGVAVAELWFYTNGTEQDTSVLHNGIIAEPHFTFELSFMQRWTGIENSIIQSLNYNRLHCSTMCCKHMWSTWSLSFLVAEKVWSRWEASSKSRLRATILELSGCFSSTNFRDWVWNTRFQKALMQRGLFIHFRSFHMTIMPQNFYSMLPWYIIIICSYISLPAPFLYTQCVHLT